MAKMMMKSMMAKKMASKMMKKSMMKAPKMMMKKVMKKSVIAKHYKLRANAYRAVFTGKFMKTKGGLKKDSLIKSKSGKIVSKKLSLKGKKSKWILAVAKARSALKIKGFAPVGGKTPAGKKLYATAKSFFKK